MKREGEPNQLTRDEILKTLQQEHANLLTALAGVPDDVLVTRPVVEWWTLKDLLGHIATWEQVAIKFITEYQQDGLPKMLGLSDDAAVDAYNKRAAALRRDWPLARVRAEFDAAFRDLIVAVEPLSNTQLNAPLPAPWPEGHNLEKLIAINSYEHAREHVEQIRKWRR